MAKRSGREKPPDQRLRLLTSIDEKLGRLVAAQKRQIEALDQVSMPSNSMLELQAMRWSDHEQRLAAVEQRLTKAGL